MNLVTNPEILAVNWDSDCVMASQIAPIQHGRNGIAENWAGEIWVRPLSDASFVVVMVNKDPATARTLEVVFGDASGDCDLFPAGPFTRMRVRDLYLHNDVGVLQNSYSALVPPMDAVIVQLFQA